MISDLFVEVLAERSCGERSVCVCIHTVNPCQTAEMFPPPAYPGREKGRVDRKVVILVHSTAGRDSDRPHAFKDLHQKKKKCFVSVVTNLLVFTIIPRRTEKVCRG